MIDYLLTAAIVFGLFTLGIACLLWPQRMLWPARSLLAAGLSTRNRKLIAQGGGLLILTVSLFLTWRIIKDLL